MNRPFPMGLYGIADATFGDPIALGTALARGGAKVVQLRAKRCSDTERLELARVLCPIVQAAGALFIVNDDCEIARRVNADGVHLGQGDGDTAAARARLGPDRWIGRSTHTQDDVQSIGPEVDYIGFGPVYPTHTKADAAPSPGIDGLHRAIRLANVPVVAIGGISLGRLPEVCATGARRYAVISDILRHTDVQMRTQQFVHWYENSL